VSEIYQSFSLSDCEDWNRRYDKATHDNNKKEIMSLLSEANHLYFDEYFIYSTITKLNNNEFSEEEKNHLIDSFNKSRIVKFTSKQNDYISINTRANCIKVAKLSDIVPETLNDKNSKGSVVRKDKFSAEYISQLLTFPNSIVTGYVYGISDKSKKMHTWVEFKNNNNQDFVIDYDDNTVYNKEGFYFLKHAEPIKKVASDDLKGKSSVGKSSGTYSEIGSAADVIDIEIDMGDER